MRRLLVFLLMVLLALSAYPVVGPEASSVPRRINTDKPVVAPEEVGLATSRLDRLRAVMNQYVAEKKIPGGIGLIARRGKVAYQEAFGMADIEPASRCDSIRSIASTQ